jgi:hypothetical protein
MVFTVPLQLKAKSQASLKEQGIHQDFSVAADRFPYILCSLPFLAVGNYSSPYALAFMRSLRESQLGTS